MHPSKKITKNITRDEPDVSNKTEQNITILKHPAKTKNSNIQLLFDIEKMYDFSEKMGKLYIEIEAIKIFIKEYTFIVKSSIEKNRCHKMKIKKVRSF